MLFSIVVLTILSLFPRSLATFVPLKIGHDFSKAFSDEDILRGFKQNTESGEDSLKGKPFDGNIITIPFQLNFFTSEVISDTEKLNEFMGIEGRLAVSYGPMISGEGAGKFLQNKVSSRKSVTVIYTRRSVALARTAEIDTIVLTNAAHALNSAELADTYGTKFIEQVIYGAQLDVIFTVTSTTEIDIQEIEAELKGKIGVGALSVEFEAKFNSTKGDERAELEMSILAQGSGVNFNINSHPTFNEVNDLIDQFNRKYAELLEQLSQGDTIEEEKNVLNQLSPVGFTLGSIADYEMKIDKAAAAVLDTRMEELQKTMYDTLFWMARLEKSLGLAYSKYGTDPKIRDVHYVPFEKQVVVYLAALDDKLDDCLAFRKLPLMSLLDPSTASSVPKVYVDEAMYGFVGEAYIPSPLSIEGATFQDVYYEGYSIVENQITIPWLSGVAKSNFDDTRIAVADTPKELKEKIEYAVHDRVDDGEPCSTSQDCYSKLCDNNVCVRGDGDFCEENFHCQSGRCEGSDPGNSDGTCQPVVGDGETCDEHSDCESINCANQVCLRQVGDACANDQQCETERCIVDGKTRGTSHTCEPKLAAGDGICSTNRHCQSGYCNSGICRGDIYDECDMNGDCASGRCELTIDKNICQEPLGASEKCDEDSDCKSGRCDSGSGRCIVLIKNGWSGYLLSLYGSIRAEFFQSNGQQAALCGINSHHSDDFSLNALMPKDRLGRFKYCTPVQNTPTVQTEVTLWSLWTFQSKVDCPSDSFISLIESAYHSPSQDRMFKYTCSKFMDLSYVPGTCYWSGYKNYFKKELKYECPSQYVMAGLNSYFSTDQKDRRFSIKCCKLH